MRIAIGSDHAGFNLKGQLVRHLQTLGHEVVDVGTSSDEVTDYPLHARAAATEVAGGRCDRGIVIDGAGIGSAMVANKVPGIRAALAYDLSTARNSREHNDANVLTLGAGLIGPKLAEEIVSLWLQARCTEERHLRRVGQIEGPVAASASQPSQQTIAGPAQISEEDLSRILHEVQRLAEGRQGQMMTPPSIRSGRSAASVVRRGSPPVEADRMCEGIARFIDHTLLRPEATEAEIRKLCAQAREWSFIAVCVNPLWTPLAARELRGSPVKVCSVVGFPLGASPAEVKALEARRAIREGAREIDMVIPVGALKGGDEVAVLRDIRAVVEACRDGSALCKVIIETAFLTDEEKRAACRQARRAGAGFVKTSTGFGPGGATVEDVALMAAEVAGSGMGVKAAGGIRTLADARKMIEAGATRIGTSRGVEIAREAREAPAHASWRAS